MFACSECGAQSLRWEGRCKVCGTWGSLDTLADAGNNGAVGPVALSDVSCRPAPRTTTGFAELDRVLGGGWVAGSVVLIGGEPGIGKSTLLLQVGGRSATRTVYVAGEESPEQIALRAQRLGVRSDALYLLDTCDPDAVAQTLTSDPPALCIVDSVQTLVSAQVNGVPGGPAQVRGAAARLVPAARASRCTLVLVGQMTKDGGLAGPRFLEHAVDAVLLFEGDRHLRVRALRSVKNRFGATDEIGLFEMGERGLCEVERASDLLLTDRRPGPGSVVAAVVEGRRALCVEVQALLVGERRPVVRRRAQGVDARRLELLVGVVESLFCGEVAGRDVFVNVVGGLAVRDRGLDLAVAAAVLGAQLGLEVDREAVVIGEVGLRGEVRPVPRLEARLKEARAMGFGRALVPAGCGAARIPGLELREVEHIQDALLPWGESVAST